MHQCRLCLEDGVNLLAPCVCRGSVQFVHPLCLQNEVNYSLRNECSICKTPYDYRLILKQDQKRTMFTAALLFLLELMIYSMMKKERDQVTTTITIMHTVLTFAMLYLSL